MSQGPRDEGLVQNQLFLTPPTATTEIQLNPKDSS
jgi:hypothetical protein